jgi:multidrug efflux system membrane fusion protein
MKSSHILAVALAIGATAWVLSGQFGDEAPETASTDDSVTDSDQSVREITQVRVRQSVSESYVLELTVTGRTEANRAVSLRVQTSGRISEILVEEGQFVEGGQVIARIAADDRPERLARAQALVQQYQVAFDASSELAESGWRAETANAEALAELRNAHAELAVIRLDIARTEVSAPFSGVLNSLNIELGDVVTEGFGEADQVGQIFDLDPVIVIASVSEREVSRISVGDVGRARLVTGEVVEGVVRFVGQVAEPETRTFLVKLEVPNESYSIPAGLTADVILPLDTITSHFISPSALSLGDDGTLGVKLVTEDNTVRFVPVTIVADKVGGLWVAGLPYDVTLITVGHDYVIDGEVVEPVEVEGSSFSQVP